VIADGDSRKRKTQIVPVIKDAAVSHALPLWDSPIEKQYQLNASIKHTDTLPSKALVFKKDFWVWWKQTNAVPLPQRLIDLGGCDIHVTPDIENLIAENEDLKAKVAELEKKLSKRIDVREQTTYQNLIVALLDCINGDSNIEKHPSFDREQDLINFLDKKYEGYYGLTQSNLSKKLPKIKDFVKKQLDR